MKPEHFKDLEAGSCGQCCHRLWIKELEKTICTRHAFILPTPLGGHVCDDFRTTNPGKPARRPITEYLDSPTLKPLLMPGPATLVIQNVWIDSCDLTSMNFPTPTHGVIEGSSKGMGYKFKFQATDVLVEEARICRVITASQPSRSPSTPRWKKTQNEKKL